MADERTAVLADDGTPPPHDATARGCMSAQDTGLLPMSNQLITSPMPAASRSSPSPLAAWRLWGLGLVRIAFGIVWAADAWLKWQPAFLNHVTSQLAGVLAGQPAPVKSWISFWVRIVSINPHAFATVEAIMETALAVALLLGAFTQLAAVCGALLSLYIWSTAEGFGGPYGPGSVQIGPSVVYVLVWAALFLTSAGLYLGVDRYLTPRLGRWGFLASGPLPIGSSAAD